MKKILFLTILSITSFSISIKAQCWEKVVSRSLFTLAIKTDGTLWGWGRGSAGQFGNGSLADVNIPTQIGTDNDWKEISVGMNHCFAIKSNGSLWGWGLNSGSLFSIGGLLGDGTTVDHLIMVQIGTDLNWKKVSTAQYHTLAIKTDGSLWSWGSGTNGILGHGNTNDLLIPTKVGIDTNWQFITNDIYISFAIKTDGSLWAWGENQNGQLGDGTLVEQHSPKKIGSTNDWKQVSTGGGATIGGGKQHTHGVKVNGTLWGWGNNSGGYLGNGSTSDVSIPTQIGTNSDWIAVSDGTSSTYAIKTNGTLWATGDNFFGQLGNGSTNADSTFALSGTFTNHNSIAANPNGENVFLIHTDYSLWAAGRNYFASINTLGDGTSNSQSTPVQLNCWPLGINEFVEEQLNIIPNPTRHTLTLQISNNKIPKCVQITDILGKKIMQVINSNTFSVEHLSNGIYFLNTTINGKQYQTKFVKK